ncbi:MAG: phosphohydrolase, partial [Actinobacteria bacterium]|nr:phosphohydrolase [Actinomycetota bacterium]
MVLEVTDDKSLEKNERKRLQIEHASHKSPGAALIKLADKISNVRDVGVSPPSHWDIQRRVDYLDWASAVVGALPLKDHILLT